MKLLKILTSRNAFSREYGTWLIVIFNLICVPVVFSQINQRVILYSLSVIFFLLFRFELLDYYSINIQYKRRKKLILAIAYLSISGLLFGLIQLNPLLTVSMGLTGVALTVFNIVTRRKKGKRQALVSQIILVVFIAFIGAFSYYLLFDEINSVMFTLLIINALYYINSLIYVRSKTVGAPYHILALVSVIVTIGLIGIFGNLVFLKPILILLFIPSLVKVLDNVILENKKVHLRRVGVNEVFHSVLFLLLMNHLASSI